MNAVPASAVRAMLLELAAEHDADTILAAVIGLEKLADPEPRPRPPARHRDRILEQLRHGSLTRDQLSERTGIKPACVSARLTDLHKAGEVERVGSGRWRVVA